MRAQVDKATVEFEKLAKDYANILSQLKTTDEEVIRRSSSVTEDGVKGGGSTTAPQQVSIEFESFTIVDAALLEERKNEVLKIAREAEAVKEMMKDMALLVGEQGEMLDEIEDGVQVVKTKVEKGNKEIEKGIEAQKRKRKCMCIVTVVMLVLLGVILGPIIAKVNGNI
jgi:t-SNARE complex subunit (syntaxin)